MKSLGSYNFFFFNVSGLISLIDRSNEFLGKAVSWLALTMACIQFIIITLLFIFNLGFLWLQELILYMNGTLFMIALGWAFKNDNHVRVDVFYRMQSSQKKAKINLIGIICLLLPICATMLWTSLPYTINAWQTLEGSRETGGIPALFILKTIIPISAILLALQAFAEILRIFKTLQSSK